MAEKKRNRFKKKIENPEELTTDEWDRLNKEYFGEDNATWVSTDDHVEEEFDENGEPRELDF